MAVVTLLNAVSANTTGPIAGFGTPYGNLTLSVSTSGTVSAFSVVLQGSNDGVNFGSIGSAITSMTAGTSMGTGVLFQYFQAVLSGYSGTGTVTAELAYSLEASTGGGGPPVPQAQAFSLANNTYSDVWQWTVTGQTDSPLPSFGLVAGSKTYGTSPAIQGPAAWFGYNPVLLSTQSTTSAHSAAGISFFADAGDTNSSGAHGVECNISWASPNYSTACNAFQLVAVDDTTCTVNTTMRCGSGSSGSYTSSITFENANASTVFAVMSNANADVTFYTPVAFSDGITGAVTMSASGTMPLILDGNNGGNANGELQFQTAGTAQWNLTHFPPYLYVTDVVNARTAAIFYPGSTPAASKAFFNSVLWVASSVVCGTAAIATTATSGFLYLPSCAGAPTGTPAAQTGTIPCVFDTTDGKLWFYTGGAWVGLAD